MNIKLYRHFSTILIILLQIIVFINQYYQSNKKYFDLIFLLFLYYVPFVPITYIKLLF